MALGELFAGLVRGREDLFEVVEGPRFALTVVRCRVRGEVDGRENGKRNGDIAKGDILPNGHIDTTSSSTTTKTSQETTNAYNAKPIDYTTSNALTKKVYETINSRGEIFLTSSVLDGLYTIRVVSANERAEEKYVRRAFEILVGVCEEMRNTSENDLGDGMRVGR